VSDIQ